MCVMFGTVRCRLTDWRLNIRWALRLDCIALFINELANSEGILYFSERTGLHIHHCYPAGLAIKRTNV
jgi:hypothetical protein